jgi:hypothetical protein
LSARVGLIALHEDCGIELGGDSWLHLARPGSASLARRRPTRHASVVSGVADACACGEWREPHLDLRPWRRHRSHPTWFGDRAPCVRALARNDLPRRQMARAAERSQRSGPWS